MGRFGTTSEEPENLFQRTDTPGTASRCVSEVRYNYFTISISFVLCTFTKVLYFLAI